MRPLRLILFIFSCFFLFVCLVYVSLSIEVDPDEDPGRPSQHRDYSGSPFLRNPAFLFTPSATISLTDDNSTFFAARPAAFGPPLPDHGFSGQLWIGSGFSETLSGSEGYAWNVEGELGCGDIPGWEDRDWKLRSDPSRTEGKTQHIQHAEDNTDDHLHHPLEGSLAGQIRDVNTLGHGDIQSLQEAAAISGKIALLSRGGCGFAEKVLWAQRRGATAVIVGDDIRGGPLVRMSAHGDGSNVSIPALFTSHTTAHLLSSLMPTGSQAGFLSHRGPGEILPVSGGGSIIPSSGEYKESIEALNHLVSTEVKENKHRQGLWVTLSPTDMTASPFLNTLFVLVISPLFTLAIVYSMLLLRSRIRRRRWRAPKSVVDRLPVHIYHRVSRSSSSSSTRHPTLPTSTTPLLTASHPKDIPRLSSVQHEEAIAGSASSSRYGSLEPSATTAEEEEKTAARMKEWKRKYRGRQNECVVCLEDYEDGVSKVMSLPCGHEFHAECM